MRRTLPALAIALALLPGCSAERRLPTEADQPTASGLSNTTDAAKGGNPHKPPKKGGGELRATIQPDVWNIQWKNSQGTVSALIQGSDLDKIDTSTFML